MVLVHFSLSDNAMLCVWVGRANYSTLNWHWRKF